MRFPLLSLCLILLFVCWSKCEIPASYRQSSPWTWTCRNSKCIKIDMDDIGTLEEGFPLAVCKLNCAKYGVLWPKPTGKTELGKGLVAFYPQNVVFEKVEGPTQRTSFLANEASKIFKTYLIKSHPDNKDGSAPFPENNEADGVSKNSVKINIAIAHPYDKITLDVEEGYLLSIQKQDDERTVSVHIQATTYFGARHALETLSQLIAYDEVKNSLQIVDRALVQDRPSFRYRGILLDVSRNFISMEKLKRLVDGMSYNKINVLHMHLTDTHSFPFYSKSVPQLTRYGAYSPRKIYTVDDLKNLIEYATIRGVKIIPEFDAPAHVGNGWQWGPSEGKGNLAVCVNAEPWQEYAVEPPAGQLNIVNEDMYKILSELYKDILEVFDNDVFHMGGDEVNMNCWNSSSEITQYLIKNGKDLSHESFLGLWSNFQSRALGLLKNRSKDKNITAILWTSDLTKKEHIQDFLDKKDYVIQIWSTGNDPIIPYLIEEGYRVIFSNYDAWYLDCGYGAWIGGGPSNWCPPYKGWQQVYGNSPIEIFRNASSDMKVEDALKRGLILGGEAALWTEQTDGSSLESKIWPRASALAERLWTNPKTNWAAAEMRMIHNRNRYVERGLEPDRLQPEWCHHNEGLCYL